MTVVTLQSGGSGQQQQSSSQFSTGQWTSVPLLYRLADGAVIAISTLAETYYLYAKGTQIQMSAGEPSAELAAQMGQSYPLPLKPVEAMPKVVMPPMQPMSTMQPMHLKLGNMEMSMGTAASAFSTASSSARAESKNAQDDIPAQDISSETGSSQTKVKQFCTQCGSAIDPSDRFCGYCGARLA